MLLYISGFGYNKCNPSEIMGVFKCVLQPTIEKHMFRQFFREAGVATISYCGLWVLQIQSVRM